MKNAMTQVHACVCSGNASASHGGNRIVAALMTCIANTVPEISPQARGQG